MTIHLSQTRWPLIPSGAAELVAAALAQDRRLMLFGAPGVGKSTLARDLARALAERGRSCWCISADPGSPAVGFPGALSLGHWREDEWKVSAFEPLCSLDAGRFRLPLVSAVGRLQQLAGPGAMLLDSPGVVRGVAGRELLAGLIGAGRVDAVLAICAANRPPPLEDELRAAGIEVLLTPAASAAKRPHKRARAQTRTDRWDGYLADAGALRLELPAVEIIGTPPPRDEPAAWAGRQAALLRAGKPMAMAEVLRLDADGLVLKAPPGVPVADSVLIRDAQRGSDGRLETAAPFAAERIAYLPPSLPFHQETGGPSLVGRMGALDFALVNGVFGDPMLHVRLRHLGRSAMFDLGEGNRLSARVAHQVSDAFISHAHMDHLGGFQWLLRSRLGEYPACRLFGPPGLAGHIESFLNSFLWDRIGNRGPAFEVAELHGRRLQRVRLQAGIAGRERLDEREVTDGILLEEPGFRVRAVELDHHTPVLAFALELAKTINVRKDRLRARGLEPGPWLARLKQLLLAEKRDAILALPDGSQAEVGALADELLLVLPGKKLVYATDLADQADNRRKLVELAHNAHTLFCEAAFCEADVASAAKNGHLTTRATGEIASAAGVSRLIPFHFSQRYRDNPALLFEELGAACERVVLPPSMQLFESAGAEPDRAGLLPDQNA